MKNSPYLDKPLRSLAEAEAQQKPKYLRQPCLLRPSPSADEIEITPTMIEAGTSVIYGEPGIFAGPMGSDSDAGDLVARVYRAMERGRLSSLRTRL